MWWNPFKKAEPPKVEQAVERPPTKKRKLSPKEQATKDGEPYVTVVSVEIDKDDPGNGAFELDFNDIFVARLIKAGYKGRTDADIVDAWFHSVCLNVINDSFEQEMADPEKRREFGKRRDLGDGRAEFR